jgi:carbon storage regulator CsrA
MSNLILSRKEKESVVIVVGGEVIATVTKVGDAGVRTRLAFEASDTVKFYRQEVWQRMQKEGKNG